MSAKQYQSKWRELFAGCLMLVMVIVVVVVVVVVVMVKWVTQPAETHEFVARFQTCPALMTYLPSGAAPVTKGEILSAVDACEGDRLALENQAARDAQLTAAKTAIKANQHE